MAVALPHDCFSQATPEASNVALDSSGNKIFGSVLKELMRMIPGEIDPGSSLDASLKEVVELFSNRKLKEAQAALELSLIHISEPTRPY